MKTIKQLQNLLFATFLIFLFAACGGDEKPTNIPDQNNTSFNSIEEARDAGQGAMTYAFESLKNFSGDAFYEFNDFNHELRRSIIIDNASGRMSSDVNVKELLYHKMFELGKNFVEHEAIIENNYYRKALITFDIIPGTYTVQAGEVSYTADKEYVEVNFKSQAGDSYKLVYEDPEGQYRIFGQKVPATIVTEEENESYSSEDIYDSEYHLFFDYLEDEAFFEGTLTIYKNDVEEVKYEAAITGEYKIFENGGVDFDHELARYALTVYKRGKLFVKELLEPASFTTKTTLYDDSGVPTDFTFNLELFDKEAGAYQKVPMKTLETYKRLIPYMLAFEYAFNSTEGNLKIEVDITKGNNEINYVLNYSRLNKTLEEIYAEAPDLKALIKNTNAYTLISGGFVKIDGELVFTLAREGEKLYADYEYGQTRIEADGYVKDNFQPLEDAIENSYIKNSKNL